MVGTVRFNPSYPSPSSMSLILDSLRRARIVVFNLFVVVVTKGC
jgi:hypothetical protein